MRVFGFLAVVSVVLGLSHYYLWARLVRDPGWPTPIGSVGAWLLAGLACSMPVAMVLGRATAIPGARAVSFAAFTWMGVAFLLIVAVFLGDVVRWIVSAAAAFTGTAVIDHERRRLLARGLAGAASASATVLGAISVRSATSEVQVHEVNVALGRLPRTLSGLTLVQLTDMHIGSTVAKDFAATVVEKTNALRPDAVVITGDLVDGSVLALREQVAPLARLRARFGVYFVTGNHEYYSGVDQWIREIERLGIRVLRNERVTIGDQGGSIDLAGVDDPGGDGFGPQRGPDYAKAFRDLDPEREIVLLAHRPRQVIEAAKANVGLHLAGHTHGGQIWPWGYLVRLTEPYVQGLHRHTERTQIYVSPGTGHWGPPMRLFTPAEITKVVLSPA
jgi:uncharacterized protein